MATEPDRRCASSVLGSMHQRIPVHVSCLFEEYPSSSTDVALGEARRTHLLRGRVSAARLFGKVSGIIQSKRSD